MKGNFSRVVAVLLSVVMLVVIFPAMSVEADLGGWTTAANGVMTITGTSITVRLSYGTLYVEGVGAIPDYTPETYTMRPWHYLDFNAVSIANTITEIGSYAFADKACLKQVNMASTTFIKDNTCFTGIYYDPVFRVRGTAVSQKQYQTIIYTSLDSIAANAPNAAQCAFIMDSYAAAQTFRQKSYPYLKHVYSAEDTAGPWNSKVDTTKGITFNPVCKISKDNDMGVLTNMTAQMRSQGPAYIELISNFLGEYTYLCSYNMALTDQKGTIYGTNGAKKYVLYLPAKEQIVTRQYRLIEIGPDGQLLYLDDLDSNYQTVTFSTYYPTSTYALVYKYDLAALSIYNNTLQ